MGMSPQRRSLYAALLAEPVEDKQMRGQQQGTPKICQTYTGIGDLL
jgi:hypothetical protein